MSSPQRKLPLVALALLAALALGACGDSHTRVTTGTYAGESGANAPYLDVGPLTYEVQLSRELSPYNLEDASESLTISDTQNNVYSPVVPGPTNPFAYRGGIIPASGRLPELSSTAANGPTQGVLLLYKIQIVSLDNRPLELKIVDPTNSALTASAELDV